MHSSNRSARSAPRRHLVFLQYYFPPMGGGGVQRIVKFLKFADYDRWDITVLTVKASFFYTEDHSLPADIPDAARIVRSGSLDPFRLMHVARGFRPGSAPSGGGGSESGGWMRRLAMSLFVPDSRLLWYPFAAARLRRLHRDHPIDAVVASMPPFTTGLIGRSAARMNIPLILDFRDAWSDNPYLPRISGIHDALSRRMERACLKAASGVIFINPALERQYRRRFAELERMPTTTIRNGFDPDDFRNLPREPLRTGAGPFRLGIMGTVYSQGNRPLPLLAALREMLAADPGLPERFKLIFLGKWTPEFDARLTGEGLDPIVERLPYQPHDQALATASGFDALCLAIENDRPGSGEVTPGRIYEYLALRRPVLALCPVESDLADLVRDHAAGEVVPYGDVAGTREVVERWMAKRERLAHRYGGADLSAFSRKDQAGAILDFVERVLARREG